MVLVDTKPMDSGLPKDVVLRLLTCNNRPTEADRRKYEGSQHFKSLRDEAVARCRTCALCNRSKGLTIHHRHYRSLFREDLLTDIVVICRRCHGGYHARHRHRG